MTTTNTLISRSEIPAAEITAAVIDATLCAQLRSRLAAVADERGQRLELPRLVPGRPPAVIGRVADAEPLCRTEEAAARRDPAALLRGLGALSLLAGSRRVVLAVRTDLRELLRTFRRLAAGTAVQVVAVPACYPQDDASLRCEVAAALGKGAANYADAVVLDAVVLTDVARALAGERVTHRVVSVVGAVARPATLVLPLGCSVEAALELCGGATRPAWVAYENGAVGGRRVDGDAAVDLATRSLVVLPADHARAVADTVPLADRERQAAAACVHCRLCTEGCPVWLTGGSLEPDRLLRSLAWTFGVETPRDEALSLAALSCLGCGACSLRCPASVDPGRLVQATAACLREQGVELVSEPPLAPHPERALRRVGNERLLQVLRPLSVDQPPIDARAVVPRQLVLPLVDPAGSPRSALATAGDEVRRGDLLLQGDRGGRVVDVHAPLSGVVEAIDLDLGLILRCR